MALNHLVLVGDSVFDNGAYTAGGPPVITQVQRKLPPGWTASLLAVDGALTSDIEQQLAKLPKNTTHLALSAGGNHALLRSGFLMEPAQSVADVFMRMSAIRKAFEADYQYMLDRLLARSLPTTVCTIYNPNFEDQSIQALAIVGLIAYNDCILRQASVAGLPVVDLRQVCTQPTDYANGIEPSAVGGGKIAAALVRAVTTHEFSAARTTIYS
jgi:hypothetical protein